MNMTAREWFYLRSQLVPTPSRAEASSVVLEAGALHAEAAPTVAMASATATSVANLIAGVVIPECIDILKPCTSSRFRVIALTDEQSVIPQSRTSVPGIVRRESL